MLDPEGGVVRGTLDVLILKALSWGPRHGYAVAEWIARRHRAASCSSRKGRSTPRCTVSRRRAGCSANGGCSDNNRRAKFYALSPSGRRQLRAEVTSWERYARAVVAGARDHVVRQSA